MKDRLSIKFGGESGQGINSLGKFVSKALKETGYHTFAYREYPSIIRGGFASYQIDFSSVEVLSPSEKTNILVCIDKEALEKYRVGDYFLLCTLTLLFKIGRAHV